MPRPKGSKNHPKFSEFTGEFPKPKPIFLSIPKNCLKIIHDRAKGSGLSPQMVLEDLIIAGDFTMGPAYDNLTNFRNRIRSKATERNHVQPVTTLDQTRGNSEPDNQNVAAIEEEPDGSSGTAPIQNGSHDVASQRGHRPEDNPAFRDPSGVGDVTGVVGSEAGVTYQYSSGSPEEGEPIEPQEEFSGYEEQ